MELLFFTLLIVGVGICLWVNDCYTKTNTDILQCLANLVKAVSKKEITQEEFNTYILELDRVPYHIHWLRLITLRDPVQLYSAGLARFF